MSLTRYAPQLGQAFRLIASEPVTLVRCAAAWFTLALAAHFAKGLGLPGGGVIPFALNALAFGAFAVAWQRFVALGEKPKGPVAVHVGLRALGWAITYQVFLGFEAVVTQLFAIILAGNADAQIIALAGTQLFQLLIGPMLLMLPHAALWRKGEKGVATLQELVIAGGLAVGLGYVLAGLPFTLATLALAALAPMLPAGPATEIGLVVAQFVVSFLAVTVMAGYYALVWQDLRANTVSRMNPAPDGEKKAEAPKERRTHRLSKKKG